MLANNTADNRLIYIDLRFFLLSYYLFTTGKLHSMHINDVNRRVNYSQNNSKRHNKRTFITTIRWNSLPAVVRTSDVDVSDAWLLQSDCKSPSNGCTNNKDVGASRCQITIIHTNDQAYSYVVNFEIVAQLFVWQCKNIRWSACAELVQFHFLSARLSPF